MRTLTIIHRTKSEAKAAIKAGETIHVTNHAGEPLPQAEGGPFLVSVQKDHYKAWAAEAYVRDGRVYRLV